MILVVLEINNMVSRTHLHELQTVALVFVTRSFVEVGKRDVASSQDMADVMSEVFMLPPQ